MKKEMIIIGYSGHAFVICDICELNEYQVLGYCENKEKSFNPYQLNYLGTEADAMEQLQLTPYFIAIGSNKIRHKIQNNLQQKGLKLAATLLHPSAIIAKDVKIGKGTLVTANAVINPQAIIGEGAIINTSCVIEHEAQMGNYTYIGTNSTILGAASIGDFTYIDANVVVQRGVKIGENVRISAGTVVTEDIPDNTIL